MSRLLICIPRRLYSCTLYTHTIQRRFGKDAKIVLAFQSTLLKPTNSGAWSTVFKYSYPFQPIRLRSSQQSELNDKRNEFKGTQSGRRRRIALYLGGFVFLHICFLLSTIFYKKTPSNLTNDHEYVDPDLGKTVKMFYYKGYLLPYFVNGTLKLIDDFSVREKDVFVASFPKSGTTWLQEIVYFIERGPECAQDQNMEQRFPYMEFIYPGVKEISQQNGQRMIKTHLPYCLLPADVRGGKGKVIYIARNPKDVSVSYFHYVRMLSEVGYKGDFKTFFWKFFNDKVPYAPWWQHVDDYWRHRHDSNILFITYEELHKDLVGSVQRVAQFLGHTLTVTEAVAIAGHCCFSTMKQNPASNYSWWDDLGLRKKGETAFMRKGKVGDWQNYYTTDMAERVDALVTDKLATNQLYLPDTMDKIGSN